MTQKYKPYKLDAFKELMQYCYMLGFYPGTWNLFQLRMVGGFELNGRASESWDHYFALESVGLKDDNGNILTGLSLDIKGDVRV